MRHALAAALAAIMLVPGRVDAAGDIPVEVRASAVEFYSWCTSEEPDGQFLCTSYLLGTIDAFALVNAIHAVNLVAVCPQGTVSVAEARDQIVAFIGANLDSLSAEAAPMAIAMALAGKPGFACEP